jgi:rhodanese-related sulfurtransferase
MTTRATSTPTDLATLIAQKNVPYLLIDVRSPEEFASGHIPNAINIPLDVIPLEMPKIDHKEVIYTYCNTGIMASMAADKLKSAGYTNVVFGAIGDWKGQLETGGNGK